jgi:ABC-type nitrate/sulfonate/bicarbonate transport system substrate-binding protein
MGRQSVGRTLLARAPAQVKLKTSYASTGATNAIWNLAKERGCDKKHGLEVEVVHIGKLI